MKKRAANGIKMKGVDKQKRRYSISNIYTINHNAKKCLYCLILLNTIMTQKTLSSKKQFFHKRKEVYNLIHTCSNVNFLTQKKLI